MKQYPKKSLTVSLPQSLPSVRTGPCWGGGAWYERYVKAAETTFSNCLQSGGHLQLITRASDAEGRLVEEALRQELQHTVSATGTRQRAFGSNGVMELVLFCASEGLWLTKY